MLLEVAPSQESVKNRVSRPLSAALSLETFVGRGREKAHHAHVTLQDATKIPLSSAAAAAAAAHARWLRNGDAE